MNRERQACGGAGNPGAAAIQAVPHPRQCQRGDGGGRRSRGRGPWGGQHRGLRGSPGSCPAAGSGPGLPGGHHRRCGSGILTRLLPWTPCHFCSPRPTPHVIHVPLNYYRAAPLPLHRKPSTLHTKACLANRICCRPLREASADQMMKIVPRWNNALLLHPRYAVNAEANFQLHSRMPVSLS